MNNFNTIQTLSKTSQNQATTSRWGGRDIMNAIADAASKTGVDFSYLVQKASTESNFNPNAKAKTSSATGLYQFLENTWLSMMSKHGANCGYGDLAEAITTDKNGRCQVSDKFMKQKILALREDPKAASLMAASFAQDNGNYLEERLGRSVNSTDLYMAHFMGAGGAAKFLTAMEKNPNQIAVTLFPEAANANKGVFYSKDGTALSLKEIYNRFEQKFDENKKPLPVDMAMAATKNISSSAETHQILYPTRPILNSTEPTTDISPENSSFFSRAHNLLPMISTVSAMLLSQLPPPGETKDQQEKDKNNHPPVG